MLPLPAAGNRSACFRAESATKASLTSPTLRGRWPIVTQPPSHRSARYTKHLHCVIPLYVVQVNRYRGAPSRRCHKRCGAHEERTLTVSKVDQPLRLRAETMREIALEVVTEAQRVIRKYLVDTLPTHEGDAPRRPIGAYSSSHTGDEPVELDAIAAQCASDRARKLLHQEGFPVVIDVGEEWGGTSPYLEKDTIIARHDSLDGTTASRILWDMFASVVTFDQVITDPTPSTSGVRHLAGAIGLANQFVVSWAHWSSRNAKGEYRSLNGEVVLHDITSGRQHALAQLRAARDEYTVAAVAGTAERWSLFEPVASKVLRSGGKFSNLGGTPSVLGLILGDLTSLYEPKDVTLHDSVHLIPFQLLGGSLSTADGLLLDYLSLYEKHARVTASDHRPVPGYATWVESRPAWLPAPNERA